MIVKVPEGTIIRDDASGKIIADMSGKNMREVILKGGRGGAGNMHFATPTMQVPKFAIFGFAFVTIDKMVDFPTFGYPTSPTSAITFNSKRTQSSIAG